MSSFFWAVRTSATRKVKGESISFMKIPDEWHCVVPAVDEWLLSPWDRGRICIGVACCFQVCYVSIATASLSTRLVNRCTYCKLARQSIERWCMRFYQEFVLIPLVRFIWRPGWLEKRSKTNSGSTEAQLCAQRKKFCEWAELVLLKTSRTISLDYCSVCRHSGTENALIEVATLMTSRKPDLVLDGKNKKKISPVSRSGMAGDAMSREGLSGTLMGI